MSYGDGCESTGKWNGSYEYEFDDFLVLQSGF